MIELILALALSAQTGSDVETLLSGAQLSPEQAALAEARPDDPNSHLLLAGYHFARPKEWLPHALWLIRHRPGSPAFGTPLLAPSTPSAAIRQELSQAWLEVARAREVAAEALRNAVNALQSLDPRAAVAPARRLMSLDPSCDSCRVALGNLLALAALHLGHLDDSGTPICLSEATPPEAPDASADARVLAASALTLQRYAALAARRCGTDADAASKWAVRAARKAVALDHTLAADPQVALILDAPPETAQAGTLAVSPSLALEHLIYSEPMVRSKTDPAGSMRCRLTISTDGRVAAVQVLSGPPALAAAAIDAARKYRFRPFTAEGRLVPALAVLEIR